MLEGGRIEGGTVMRMSGALDTGGAIMKGRRP